MSYKDQYSYWLNVVPCRDDTPTTETPSIVISLQNEYCVWPAGPLVLSTMPVKDNGRVHFRISGEVNPDEGTVEENADLHQGIARVARQYPAWRFEFKEIDEDNKSFEKYTVWEEGREFRNTSSRMVHAEDDYDAPTINDIIAFLRSENMLEAARRVKAAFLPKSEDI